MTADPVGSSEPMDPSVVPTVIIVVVLVAGLTVMFVVMAMGTAADERRKREQLRQLGLRLDDPKRLHGVGSRGGREVTVELIDMCKTRGRRSPRGAKVYARAVLPVPVLLLVSRNVYESEWPRLRESYWKHEPQALTEVTTGDARFDSAFRT